MRIDFLYLKTIEPISKKQRGSALVMAIFVIVVLMLLGSALVQILSTSSETIAQEVIGTRALAAANSGMQADLQKLFPLTAIPTITPLNCPSSPAENVSNYDFSAIPGLYHCFATVICTNYATGPDGTLYYRLTSTGECGSGTLAANSFDKSIVISSRTVQVEARGL